MPSSDYKQTAELRPCPFCQRKAMLCNNPRGDMYWIECGYNPAHCQTAPGRREGVIALWNTRPAEDALNAKLAGCKSSYDNLQTEYQYIHEVEFPAFHAELASKDAEIKALYALVGALEGLSVLTNAHIVKMSSYWPYIDNRLEYAEMIETARARLAEIRGQI